MVFVCTPPSEEYSTGQASMPSASSLSNSRSPPSQCAPFCALIQGAGEPEVGQRRVVVFVVSAGVVQSARNSGTSPAHRSNLFVGPAVSARWLVTTNGIRPCGCGLPRLVQAPPALSDS